MSDEIHTELQPEVEKSEAVIVYDRETGAVQHVHRVFTWRGGEHPGREELEREAREQAAFQRKELGEVELLHVDPQEIPRDAVLRVDPRRRKLVAKPVKRTLRRR